MTQDLHLQAPTLFPRRTFVAALLSAVTAAVAVGALHWGQLDAPDHDSFNFSRGTSFAEGEEARLRGFLTPAISNDRLAVVITGHTGNAGNPDANQTLSENRAKAAARIAMDLGIPDTHITAAGVGGTVPLAKQDGQSEREYQSTLSRIDVTLRVLK